MDYIFFLQATTLANNTTFFRLWSLRSAPGFPTTVTQRDSVLPFVSLCYVPVMTTANFCPLEFADVNPSLRLLTSGQSFLLLPSISVMFVRQFKSFISREHMGSKLEITTFLPAFLVGLRSKLDKYIADSSPSDRFHVWHCCCFLEELSQKISLSSAWWEWPLTAVRGIFRWTMVLAFIYRKTTPHFFSGEMTCFSAWLQSLSIFFSGQMDVTQSLPSFLVALLATSNSMVSLLFGGQLRQPLRCH